MTKSTPTDQVEIPTLVVGTAYSLGAVSEGRIMTMAAASPPNSTDPVDQAAIEVLKANYVGLEVPEVAADDVDPASLKRRYSLARIRRYNRQDGHIDDRVIMRGDLDAVLEKVKISKEQTRLVKKNAAVVIRNGWRPLAVARAKVDHNDIVGAFRLEGFIPVAPEGHAGDDMDVSTGPAVWARVRVWSASLRFQHWLNVAVIFILSCTGIFIMDPFFGATALGTDASGYLMGIIRLIHFIAAFVWLIIGAARIWSAFMSRDRYLRWPSMWPLKSKDDVKHLGQILQHYALIKEHAPLYLAHNPLQQLAYTSVYIACGLQMLSGFVLYGLYHPSNPFWSLVSLPAAWFGVGVVRLFHTLMMFGLWAFVIMHIYLVLRAESLERHGGLSAMINGGVWVKRGAEPVDAPKVE
ncbi:MAG: Ni/Fe-hydrogenase, b-type cytochrome subunit [Propionibacteriaceae bacterium]|jgi:Ni/Fe-hydrogenase b-type cytochrome subunit|nr:Ni/Fe-hydrogenase, b-type cytochrome subunit [Propionibacteriaceae bacterium]